MMPGATPKAQSARLDLRSKIPPLGTVLVTPSLSDYPRSHVANHVPPAPVTSEREALKSLKSEWRKLPSNVSPQNSRPRREVVIADLSNFEVYRCPESDRRRPYELASLHLFDVKAKNLCFDGHVRLGTSRHYLKRVNIGDISIEGYDRTSTPRTVVYLQTRLSSKDRTHDIWLRLRKPAPNYERFHDPFLWVATFGKFVVDYMEDQPRASVTLESFRTDFHTWLTQLSGHNRWFQAWHAAFRKAIDFRVALHAYIGFVYNQAANLPTSKHLLSHPVWSHCKYGPRLAIERQSNKVKDTLATAHVFSSFEHMYFGSKLKRVSLSKTVSKLQATRRRILGFAEDRTTSTASSLRTNKNNKTSTTDVRVGDVVSIVPDEVDKTKWQNSSDEWLAYVQGIKISKNGTQQLLILWLYRPADTNMCLATYPFENEVFLSDNCNCSEREIFKTDVARIHSVDWNPKLLSTTKDLIIRQTYITQDSAFVTLSESHKVCSCRQAKSKSKDWRAGDTVYITKTTDGQDFLEPVLIHEINYEANRMRVRLLLRLARDCPRLASEAKRIKVAPNELVLTGKVKIASISHIKRGCSVCFVPQEDVLNQRIPPRYDKGGAGDYWFISMGLDTTNGSQRLFFLQKLPKGFHEDREVPLPCQKLRGLSLFSGGGGLDRGLEEGGAVEFQTSVDYDSAAIHTQRANCEDTKAMRLFCGSVDDYLQSLLTGRKNSLVAQVGEVDLVAAGSPCPGFSALQQNMLSEQSLTYASHITTFCTAVDLYRPLYGILENVVNMASTRTGFEEQNVLSQLVACLVSMGYQVIQYIMDSWTYGSCQGRSRIILTIAAPGLEPILQRPHTHSRSYEDTAARSLGRLPNGERFGDREHYPTPFPIVSAQEATADLPDIGNGNVQTCIAFPDHRLSRITNSKARALIECIPRQPPGYGYAEAVQSNLVPLSLRLKKKETGKAYRRIKADELIPTITTDVNMQDARNGASVHWSQHRPLSIQDARRTQGYPDSEPIIGTIKEQWKILGNGVDRKVSFAIGLALRDALVKSKHIPELNELLEDEAELVVDAEEEDIKERLSEGIESATVDLTGEPSQSSSESSSTDTISTTRETRERFDLSLSMDDVQDARTMSQGPHLTSLQQINEVEKPPVPTKGFFSPLSRIVIANVERLSLPTFPTFILSAQSSLPAKRQIDKDGPEERGILNPVTGRISPYKRAKFVEVRRTTSPVSGKLKNEAKTAARRASLPPPQRNTHTRRSGPAEFCPRYWHGKIGTSNNVVKLS